METIWITLHNLWMALVALWIMLSNAVNGVALVVIMYTAVVWMINGRYKSRAQLVSLWLILFGAFVQFTSIHDPLGTSLDLLLLRVGVASWMALGSYKFIHGKIEKLKR